MTHFWKQHRVWKPCYRQDGKKIYIKHIRLTGGGIQVSIWWGGAFHCPVRLSQGETDREDCKKQQPCEHQGQRRRGKMFSRCWNRFPCSLWRRLCWSRFILDCSPWRRPTLELGKSVRRRKWQGWTVKDWLKLPFPISLCCSRRG